MHKTFINPCLPLLKGIKMNSSFLRVFSCFLFLLTVTAVLSAEEIPTFENLNPNHPRILITEKQCAETAALLESDSELQKLYASVEAEAEKLLKNPKTVEYLIVGPRLLTQSRNCLRRVLTLGTVYRLTKDPEKRVACRERAMAEIRAAEAFPDWNPSHFLDTAEMTAAFAVAYDWFFADLSEAERKMMADAIYEKGILPSKTRHGWQNSSYNWNQVCNGGMTLGALAIADAVGDEKKKELEETVQTCLKTVAKAMKSFAPDGAWAEGPAYWCYTTLYTIFYIEALESSLGSDFGLCDFEGFSLTGNAQIAVASPRGVSFNFADAGPGNVANSQLMWLGNRFHHPEWNAFYLQFHSGVYPTAVWYYRPAQVDFQTVPKDFYFREAEIATFRSAWQDPDAWFVGFKAGGNAVNHSHLELGNFILEHEGIRWAADLGADNYNLPGYFGSLRWTYYRLATRGQNTLCIDEQNQNPKAFAKIENFRTDSESGSASADLSEAYENQLTSARRSVFLDRKNDCVLLTDEIGAGTPETVGKPLVWQFHTQAEIQISDDGKTAVLTETVDRDKVKSLRVVIQETTNTSAHFEIRATTQGPDENPNKGIQRLVISIPVTDSAQILKVRFEKNAQ